MYKCVGVGVAGCGCRCWWVLVGVWVLLGWVLVEVVGVAGCGCGCRVAVNVYLQPQQAYSTLRFTYSGSNMAAKSDFLGPCSGEGRLPPPSPPCPGQSPLPTVSGPAWLVTS